MFRCTMTDCWNVFYVLDMEKLAFEQDPVMQVVCDVP